MTILGEKWATMYKIVDIINFRSNWLGHHPELQQVEGVLVILDPDQIRAPLEPIARVRVAKPDGSSAVLEVTEMRINSQGVVSLFFKGVDFSDIVLESLVQPM